MGVNTVLAALTLRGRDCLGLLVSGSRSRSPAVAEIVELAEGLDIPVIPTAAARLAGVDPRHQGLCLLARPQRQPGLAALLEGFADEAPALILTLDHVSDPRNLGALLRSAAVFGARGVLAPADRAAPLTQAARSASAGGSEVVPLVTVVNLARALDVLKKRGFWVVGAGAGEGGELGSFQFPSRTALVLGSEGRGLGRLVSRGADMWVGVPMAGQFVTSLNVSNAGAILMQAYFSQHGSG
ncbi:MAG: RNA methyltransferase [Deltaproteobacteria bacterium]|nr:RNA methyltransferase [Deltaproteobacteria bacterium]